jgi:beta-1,2-mannobiose phosphorylase / 1,2-beta-oligomannan phosphorylase
LSRFRLPRPALLRPALRRLGLRRVAVVFLVVCLAAVAGPLVAREVEPETAGGWQKVSGNPLIGGSLGVCFDVSVLKDGNVYKAWFSWRSKASIAYTESADGLAWSSPVIVLGPTSSGWEDDVNRPTVIERNGTYEMWYTGQSGSKSAIGYATSTDGVSWSRAQQAPVLEAQGGWELDSVMSPFVRYDATAGAYRLWYAAGDNYEPDAIGYATSPDGIHWQRDARNPTFTHGAPGSWDGAKVGAVDVEPDGSGYVMFYIGFSDTQHAQIGMARSADGITGWQRSAANPIVRPGHLFAWDGDAVYRPAVIHEPGRWLLYYNGRNGATEQIGLAIHQGDALAP